MEIELTPHQRDNLKNAIDSWLPDARRVGSMHGYWDLIFDAESVLKGEKTLTSGDVQEVYDFLIKKSNKQDC